MLIGLLAFSLLMVATLKEIFSIIDDSHAELSSIVLVEEQE